INTGATDTLTITLSGKGGVLSGTGLNGSGNTYTLSGTAASITSQLDALVFTPTASGPNTTNTTPFKPSDASTGFTVSGYASAPTVLVSFNGTDGNAPIGGVIMDAARNLFGASQVNGGTVFEIAKTANGYSSTPISLASGVSTTFDNLLMDSAGNLFGANG